MWGGGEGAPKMSCLNLTEDIGGVHIGGGLPCVPQPCKDVYALQGTTTCTWRAKVVPQRKKVVLWRIKVVLRA